MQIRTGEVNQAMGGASSLEAGEKKSRMLTAFHIMHKQYVYITS